MEVTSKNQEEPKVLRYLSDRIVGERRSYTPIKCISVLRSRHPSSTASPQTLLVSTNCSESLDPHFAPHARIQAGRERKERSLSNGVVEGHTYAEGTNEGIRLLRSQDGESLELARPRCGSAEHLQSQHSK